MNTKLLAPFYIAAAFTLTTLPASAEESVEALNWEELPAEIQQSLSPMAERWDKLAPQQQHRLVRRASDSGFKDKAERWKQLSPEERQRIRKARDRFQDMPPEKRQELRNRWENMSDDDKQKVREVRNRVKNLPPHVRQKAREDMRDMSPKQRREYLRKLKNSKPGNKNKGKKEQE